MVCFSLHARTRALPDVCPVAIFFNLKFHMLDNGNHHTEAQVVLIVAYDALAYLNIMCSTMGFSALGVEYTPAWLHVQEFIERAEQVLSAIDPGAAVKVRTKVKENAAFLQETINKHKAKKIS
jgi:hypothetical protein